MRFKELLEAPDNSQDSSQVGGNSLDDIFGGINTAADARDRARRDAQRAALGGTSSTDPTAYNNGSDEPVEPIDPNAADGRVTATPGMNPLFSMRGASRLCNPNAARIMNQDTLPRARRMAGIFGRPISINDAIAKAGTSRERETRGSQHFQGRALDINTSGMSNADKLRLVDSARAAGFRAFGFGANILHVDTGPRRAWAYGNGQYGGQAVASLISAINDNTTLPGRRSGTAVA